MEYLESLEPLEKKTLAELKSIASKLLLKASFELQCELTGDRRLKRTWRNFIYSCRQLLAKRDRPAEKSPGVDRAQEPKLSRQDSSDRPSMPVENVPASDRPKAPKTSSFVELAKPFLHHQPQFEETGNEHFANIYHAWTTFWNTDTFCQLDLPEWKSEVFDGSLAYVRVGLALQVIRLKLSYRNKNWKQEFAAFCKASPVGSTSYASKIIQAAKITIDLINLGFEKLPSCVSQVLPLAKFLPGRKSGVLSGLVDEVDNEPLAKKWQEVIDSAPDGRITSAHVLSVVTGETEEKPATVKVGKFKKNLAEEARSRGMSLQELLDEILEERYAVPPEPPEPTEEPEHSQEQLEILDECDSFLVAETANKQSSRAIGEKRDRAIDTHVDPRSPPGGDATQI